MRFYTNKDPGGWTNSKEGDYYLNDSGVLYILAGTDAHAPGNWEQVDEYELSLDLAVYHTSTPTPPPQHYGDF